MWGRSCSCVHVQTRWASGNGEGGVGMVLHGCCMEENGEPRLGVLTWKSGGSPQELCS